MEKYINLAATSGLPRSGKTRITSYMAQELDFIRFGTDDIRTMIRGRKVPDREHPMDEWLIFDVAKYLADQATLHYGKDAVVDSSAIREEVRTFLFGRTIARKTLVHVKTDKEILRERYRASGYDMNLLDEWLQRWEEPQTGKGYEIVKVKGNDEKDFEDAKRILHERFRPQKVDAGIPVA